MKEKMYANNKYAVQVQDLNFVVMFWMRLMKNATLVIIYFISGHEEWDIFGWNVETAWSVL
jgi:hypothetical protein